jgi:hypothetical protein
MTKSYLKAYGRVPIGLILQKPKASVLYVYIALDSFQGGNENAYPKIEQICERAGLKRSSVKMGIAWLVKNGWLTRVRRYAQSSLYVCLHEVAQVDESGCVTDTDEPRSVADYGSRSVADYGSRSVARIVKAQDKSTQENHTATLSLDSEPDTKTNVAKVKTTFLSLSGKGGRWGSKQTKIAQSLLKDFPPEHICENLRALKEEAMLKHGQYGWSFSMEKLNWKWEELETIKQADEEEAARLRKLGGYG